MLTTVYDVHIVDSQWPTLAISAGVGLVGAVVGAWAVLRSSRSQREAELAAEMQRRREERELDDRQHRRELLAKAADRLLDLLWTREREICAALDRARAGTKEGYSNQMSKARAELSELDLAVNQDMIMSLPFVLDRDLRERLRTAGQVINDCFNLQATTYEEYSRAMEDVQAYFTWLRWSLMCGLQGDPLPKAEPVLDVRDSSRSRWHSSTRIPDRT